MRCKAGNCCGARINFGSKVSASVIVKVLLLENSPVEGWKTSI